MSEKIKENKKIAIIFGSIVFLMIVIIGVAIMANRPKKITSIIDNKTLNRIAYVTCSNQSEVSAQAMIIDFKESRFEPYKGDLGNTAHLNFVFMDANNNILFQYTELGNNNIVAFKINGETNYYVKQGVLLNR